VTEQDFYFCQQHPGVLASLLKRLNTGDISPKEYADCVTQLWNELFETWEY
jgi:hypothetical protein